MRFSPSPVLHTVHIESLRPIISFDAVQNETLLFIKFISDLRSPNGYPFDARHGLQRLDPISQQFCS